MEITLFIFGFIIIVFTFFDFFHTTLSGRGFWFISATINKFLSRAILKNQNRHVFDYSGLLHVLITALCWLLLLVIGTFLINISYESMVVNGETKLPAGTVERFYYTCYLLSTLGIGDYAPGNDLSRITSGILSFSGFVLLTTALTYLLSVVNSVLSKKQLAFSISALGNDIGDLYNFLQLEEGSAVNEMSGELRGSVLKNASNFLAFPIINHYMTREKSQSAEVQLARLYEVLMVLRNEYDEKSLEGAKVENILRSVERYLSLGVGNQNRFEHDPDELAKLRQFWALRGKEFQQNPAKDEDINHILKSAGWSWKDVYRQED